MKKLEKALIDLKCARYLFLYALEVRGSNIYKLQEAIIKTGDKFYINEINKLIKDKERKNIEHYGL